MISGIRDNNVGEITPISKSYTIAGKTYTFETGTFALLIDGAVTIKDELGHVLLTTAGVSKKAKQELIGSLFLLIIRSVLLNWSYRWWTIQ
jgi:hypothetical protein